MAAPKHSDTEWVLEMNPIYDRMDFTWYHYSGELQVEKGYIKVPRDRSDLANRLLLQGYQWVGGQPKDFDYVR